jgi:hypothetical protein
MERVITVEVSRACGGCFRTSIIHAVAVLKVASEEKVHSSSFTIFITYSFFYFPLQRLFVVLSKFIIMIFGDGSRTQRSNR